MKDRITLLRVIVCGRTAHSVILSFIFHLSFVIWSLSSVILSLSSVMLFLAACSPSGDEMRRQLAELECMNSADSLMTNDSLAESLAKYFDRHGTPNERMRAHYILGRTYADLGEAPAAINAYQDAAACADTTAKDCDYAKLSRVYGQMSDVFFQQNLMDDYIRVLKQSIDFAWKAKDTAQALRENAMLTIGYDNQHRFDDVIVTFDSLYSQILSFQGEQWAAKFCVIPVKALLRMGDLEKARKYLDIYESSSGYFDASHNIEEGRETYYFYKGMYYLYTHHTDSAKCCFYKEQQKGSDYVNQSMASRGLSLAYMQACETDSAAKYGILSYELNDSAYAQMATKEVEQASAIYNYSRHQRLAFQEHIYSEEKKEQVHILCLLSALLLVVLLSSYYLWRKKRVQDLIAYQRKKQELQIAKDELEAFLAREQELKLLIESKESDIKQRNSEIERLHEHVAALKDVIGEREKAIGLKEKAGAILEAHESELERMVKEKEEELTQKKMELERYLLRVEMMKADIDKKDSNVARLSSELDNHRLNQRLVKEDIDSRLSKAVQGLGIHVKFSSGRALSAIELEGIDKVVGEILPAFHQFISSKRLLLNDKQYYLCLLLRMHAGIKTAAGMLDVSASYLSRESKDIMEKLFSDTGNGLKLKKRLEEFCE